MPAERPVGARAMCVWLGTLASYHPGLTGRLVREYRTMGELVQCPPSEIVEFASRPLSRRGRRASDGVPVRAAPRRSARRTRRGSRRSCAQVRRTACAAPSGVRRGSSSSPGARRCIQISCATSAIRRCACSCAAGRTRTPPRRGCRRSSTRRWWPSWGRASRHRTARTWPAASGPGSLAPASSWSAGWPWASTRWLRPPRSTPSSALSRSPSTPCGRARPPWPCSAAAPTSCTRAATPACTPASSAAASC